MRPEGKGADHLKELRSKPSREIPRPFLRSRGGVTFLVAVCIVGTILAIEHRAHLFGGDNWLWLLLLACVGMHYFMHGGHWPGDDKS